MPYSNEKNEFQAELNEIQGFLYWDDNSNKYSDYYSNNNSDYYSSYEMFKQFMEYFCKKYFNTIDEKEISNFLKELETLKGEENFTPEKKREIAVKLSVFFKYLEDYKGEKVEKIRLWRRFVNFILSLFRSHIDDSKQEEDTESDNDSIASWGTEFDDVDFDDDDLDADLDPASTVDAEESVEEEVEDEEVIEKEEESEVKLDPQALAEPDPTLYVSELTEVKEIKLETVALASSSAPTLAIDEPGLQLSSKEEVKQEISTPESIEVLSEPTPTADTSESAEIKEEEEQSEVKQERQALAESAPTLYVAEPTEVKEIKLETVALASSAPTLAVDESELQLSSKEEVAQEISTPEPIEAPIAATEEETTTSVEVVEGEARENGLEEIIAPEVSEASIAAIEEETTTSVEIVEGEEKEEEINMEVSQAPQVLAEDLASISTAVESDGEKEEVKLEVTLESEKPAIPEKPTTISDTVEPVEIKEVVEKEKEEEKLEVTPESPTPLEPIPTPVKDEYVATYPETLENIRASKNSTPVPVEGRYKRYIEGVEHPHILESIYTQLSANGYDGIEYVQLGVTQEPVPISAASEPQLLSNVKEKDESQKINNSATLIGTSASTEAGKQAVNEAESIIQTFNEKGSKSEKKSSLSKYVRKLSAPLSLFQSKSLEGHIVSMSTPLLEEGVEKEEQAVSCEAKLENSNARKEIDRFVDKAMEYANHLYLQHIEKKNKPEIERIKELIKTTGQELLVLLPAAQQAVACESKLESSHSGKEVDPLVNKAIELAHYIELSGSVRAKGYETRLKKSIKTTGQALLKAFKKKNGVLYRISSFQTSDEKGLQSRSESGSSSFYVPQKEKSIETDTNNKDIGIVTYRF